MNENSFERMEISREQVVAALKEAREAGAREDNFAEIFPEVFELLGAWTDRERVKFENDVKSDVRFNLTRADLYREAGFMAAAAEMLSDTLQYAEQLADKELIALVKSEVDKFRQNEKDGEI